MIFALSLTICMAFVMLQSRIQPLYLRSGDQFAVQASHDGDPLRIGGVAVFVAMIAFIGIDSRASTQAIGSLLIVSAMPVFVAGLLEDWGGHVSPRGRLLAAFGSGLFAVALLGAWAPRADIAGLDLLMGIPAVAISLTLVFSAGFCHALNLVDGMNGLAATVSVSSALGIASVAMMADSAEIKVLALAIAAAISGFFFLNWPRAFLFLGDGGAYAIGHLLAWMAILLVWSSEDVSVASMLLLLFWPLADTLHTIVRRLTNGSAVSRPDKMHLHQKVRRALDITWLGYRKRSISNPMTTLILLPFILAPITSGVLLWNHPRAAWIMLAAFLAAFSIAHPLVIWASRRFRK
jgi:UDP-GlcNAc:undecaprenyl-phosphate GlcNAc-1-phosphate transferase